jgi:hypothetical protein
VHYGELAAQRAMSVFAYGEAVRHLEQALRAQEVLDPDEKLKRCDLLLAVGEAMLLMEEPGRIAANVAEQAFALAEQVHDDNRAVQAALLACEGYLRGGAGAAVLRSDEYGRWTARADERSPPGTRERIYADLALRIRHFFIAPMDASPDQGFFYTRRAIEGALELGDASAIFAAASGAFVSLVSVRDLELVDRMADEILVRPRDGVGSRQLTGCLIFLGLVLLSRGERERAEEIWTEFGQVVARTHDVSMGATGAYWPAIMQFVDGHLEASLSEFEEVASAARASIGGSGRPSDVFPIHIDYLLGRDLTPRLSAFDAPVRSYQACKVLALARLGRFREAKAIRVRFANIDSDDDQTNVGILADLLEAAILERDEETARVLSRRLEPWSARLVPSLQTEGCKAFARLLGDAAALLNHPAEARDFYNEALEVCTKVRFRPEIALTRLGLAELLLDHSPDERPAAIEHLDFAIREFREMKMQPSLERALRHRELLKA